MAGQELYKEFIEAASKCNIDALQHDEPNIPALVELYVKIGRMPILSSPTAVESAELIAKDRRYLSGAEQNLP